jgi:hypothetical protein
VFPLTPVLGDAYKPVSYSDIQEFQSIVMLFMPETHHTLIERAGINFIT